MTAEDDRRFLELTSGLTHNAMLCVEVEMERCKTCKFWEPPKSQSYGEVPGVGRCQKVVQFWDAAEWDEDGGGRKLRPEFADALAFVQDGSDYRADLYTKPEFGCVQHAST